MDRERQERSSAAHAACSAIVTGATKTELADCASAEYRAVLGRACAVIVRWRLDESEVDALLDVPPGESKAIVAGRAPACVAAEANLRRLVEIDLLARRLVGDDDLVAAWARSPCAFLDHREPLQRMRRPGGLMEVRRGLEREFAEGGGIWS